MLTGDRKPYFALAGVINMRHGRAVADQLPGLTQHHCELKPFPRRIGMPFHHLPDKAFTLFPRVGRVPALIAGHLHRRAVRHELRRVPQAKPAQRNALPSQLGEALIGHDAPSAI